MHTLRLEPWYSCYKDLVKDDNNRSACPTVDLTCLSRHSAYKYNRASYFMECKLIALQWDRSSDLISLCFDARGDLDQRQPGSSFVAVVMDAPHYNYHPEGFMQPELHHLIQTSKAEQQHLWIDERRHKQGCLMWDAKGLFRSPLRGSLDRPANMTWPFQTSLVFCFANQVVSAPHYLDADCNCVELLTIPAHECYQDAFMAQCTSFELPDSLADQMRTKDEDSTKKLWQALPDAVRNNQHWWK